jgi:hypothetical protein
VLVLLVSPTLVMAVMAQALVLPLLLFPPCVLASLPK